MNEDNIEMNVKKEEITLKVADFLGKNYSCHCDADDPDCPGEYYEAQAIVDMVLHELSKTE